MAPERIPGIQFVCTSHSPQVIGELRSEEIRALDDNDDNKVTTPERSFGIDSSRVLEELMDTPARNDSVNALLRRLFHSIDKEDFDAARPLLPQVETRLGPDDPGVTRARGLMSFLESSL